MKNDDMMADRVLQFEVWNECNNKCAFCFNEFVYDITSEEKLKNIDIIMKKISNLNTWNVYNKLALIGGEFFQGQLKDPVVRDKYLELISKIDWLLQNRYLKEYWTTATLISQDQSDIYLHLDCITDKSKVWICTSYDTIGRFHAPTMEKNWSDNMLQLKKAFPQLRFNTTTILTGDFIDKYLDGRFSLRDFTEKYSTTWFGKPPMKQVNTKETKAEYNQRLPGFFPTRQKFLEFLMKFKSWESDFEYDKLFATSLRADELIKPHYGDNSKLEVIVRNKQTDEEHNDLLTNRNYVEAPNIIEDVRMDPQKTCKHNKAYSPYVDSDACFYCDKEMIRNLC